MPNHVTTVLTIVDAGGLSIEEITSSFLNEDNKVDFSIVFPVPECLKDFEPHFGVITRANAELQTPISGHPMLGSMELSNRAKAMDEDIPEKDVDAVARAIENFKECGYMYWHDFNSEVWGTKWNAYDQNIDNEPTDTEFVFQTAWSHPFNIIEAISKKLPTVTFKLQFADEDLGSNCGVYYSTGSVVFDDDISPNHSDMTTEQKQHYMEMAWNLTHGDEDPRTWGYDENWEYSEETYEKYGE